MQEERKNDLSRKRAEAGRRGGQQTFAKYGRDHMIMIAKRGAEMFHKLYKLEPVGMTQFAVVHRETGETISFLSGRPW